MTVTKLINDSFKDVKDVFNKLDISSGALDITGKFEAMINKVFIKSFLNRPNDGDYEYFRKLRDDFLQPSLPFSDITHTSGSEE